MIARIRAGSRSEMCRGLCQPRARRHPQRSRSVGVDLRKYFAPQHQRRDPRRAPQQQRRQRQYAAGGPIAPAAHGGVRAMIQYVFERSFTASSTRSERQRGRLRLSMSFVSSQQASTGTSVRDTGTKPPSEDHRQRQRVNTHADSRHRGWCDHDADRHGRDEFRNTDFLALSRIAVRTSLPIAMLRLVFPRRPRRCRPGCRSQARVRRASST